MFTLSLDEIVRISQEQAQTAAFPNPPERPLPDSIARLIDHTLLKAEALPQQIDQLCAEALEYQFASVCVNPLYVQRCAQALQGSPVKVCSVIGFPFGATPTAAKVFETQTCLEHGAAEIDMVIQIGMLRAGELQAVQDDIQAVAEATHAAGGILKVIIETCYLNQAEKIAAILLARNADADFVKTSTGFGPAGATLEDVRLMSAIAKPAMCIKSAGGIRTFQQALEYYQAGTDRIGASSGVKIVEEFKQWQGA